ncbi:AAA family ATPase [Larkinella sp.]|uniref:AAA family ATPase n=1 Tax=Larkinella sp. TaxID=2034517 RepID=UPI003BAA0C23
MESTNNFLTKVEIKNFKSIKDLQLNCKRVNVFIGKPNVGKSNILEALGLLGANYDDDKYLNGAIRYEYVRDLFRDSDPEQPITISTNQLTASVERDSYLENVPEDSFELTKKIGSSSFRQFVLSNKGAVTVFGSGSKNNRGEKDHFDIYRTSPVKKYDFLSLNTFDSTFSQYLLPPGGPNLYEIVRRNKDLWSEFAKLFTEQQLELVLFDAKQEFILQKKEGPYVKQYPFFSIADTFRRYMFYISAIESNKDSVLVFEEPEVHSFPPYTQSLAYRMIYDEDNQYFISTHSPYMLHPFIAKMDYSDLNVFITYYHDYQTKVKALTQEEFRDILDYSTNVFFNLNKFEPNA